MTSNLPPSPQAADGPSRLGETSYANAHSATVALRFQFKRRGWPLRTRAQARRARRAPDRQDPAGAA